MTTKMMTPNVGIPVTSAARHIARSLWITAWPKKCGAEIMQNNSATQRRISAILLMLIRLLPGFITIAKINAAIAIIGIMTTSQPKRETSAPITKGRGAKSCSRGGVGCFCGSVIPYFYQLTALPKFDAGRVPHAPMPSDAVVLRKESCQIQQFRKWRHRDFSYALNSE